jgi:hypothetical protein
MASFIITCPNCNTQFEPGDTMRDEIEKELRSKMLDWQKKKDEEFKNKEAGFQHQLQLKEEETARLIQKEKQKLQAELQESITKTIASDYENKLKLLQQSASDTEEKLREARKKELEFMQMEQALKTREQELELTVQIQLQKEREKLTEDIRKIEEQRIAAKESDYQMKVKELEKQLEDQKKLAEEMRRKSEQGSTQLQGEVQELLLEELLQTTFPFDSIEEVGKGVRGADCVQVVRNKFGVEAGKIIYESKRTKDFGGDWIEKLKNDMRNTGADMAVIVTQALPKDMERFGEKNGVYICTFSEVKSVALLLRNALLKIFEVRKSQDNKGDKMALLYDYLVGNEFSEQWKALRDGFMLMKQSIQNERNAMEKLWKAREKTLERVLLSAVHIKGSIEGIAGADAVNLNLVDDDEALLLE